MAERIDTSTFVEVADKDGDRYIINKDKITYIRDITTDGCSVTFVDSGYLSLDKKQMKQLFESIDNYT